MKKFALAAILTSLTAPAMAADQVYIDPMPAAPAAVTIYDWSGIYIGAVAGYGWGESSHCDGSVTPPCQAGFPNFDITGGTGGVTVGYNAQIQNWVFGVEGDYSWGKIDGMSPDTALFGCGDDCTTEVKSYGTVRGRVGYAFNNILPYATAGVSISQLYASIGDPVVAEDTETAIGYAVGGGVEVGFTPRLSGKLEYLFVGIPGEHEYDTVGACGTPGCFADDTSFHTVRAGINFRF